MVMMMMMMRMRMVVVAIGFLKFLEGRSNGKWRVPEAVEDGEELGKRR